MTCDEIFCHSERRDDWPRPGRAKISDFSFHDRGSSSLIGTPGGEPANGRWRDRGCRLCLGAACISQSERLLRKAAAQAGLVVRGREAGFFSESCTGRRKTGRSARLKTGRSA